MNSPVSGCVGGCDATVEGAEADCKERPYIEHKQMKEQNNSEFNYTLQLRRTVENKSI
jgi:hypothetical protein